VEGRPFIFYALKWRLARPSNTIERLLQSSDVKSDVQHTTYIFAIRGLA
jgi:hypothetical protein